MFNVRFLSLCLVFICTTRCWSAEPSASERSQLFTEGRALYSQSCALCHGNEGHGDGPSAMTLNPPPPDFTLGKFKYGGSRQQIFATLTNGVPGSMMVSFKQLSEKQRWALVEFVRLLSKTP